jgi:hypothetical protein
MHPAASHRRVFPKPQSTPLDTHYRDFYRGRTEGKAFYNANKLVTAVQLPTVHCLSSKGRMLRRQVVPAC